MAQRWKSEGHIPLCCGDLVVSLRVLLLHSAIRSRAMQLLQMISLKFISRQKKRLFVQGNRFQLGIAHFKITQSEIYAYGACVLWFALCAPPAFQKSAHEKAAAAHADPVTELQLCSSEKACKQNGQPAVSRRGYSEKDSAYRVVCYCWFPSAGRLFLTPAARRWWTGA